MTRESEPAYQDIGYAKINLALHVRKRRADGYHELETLFAFAEDGDRLTAAPAETLSLTLSGPFAHELDAGADNLVLRAAEALRAANRVEAGAALHLEKNLPVAAGLGGGSADAAATMRLLARLWNLGPDALRPGTLAAQLGADVPACIASQTCFGSGVGDQLTPIDGASLAGVPILLVNPLRACPTGPVFKAWDGVDRGALRAEDWMHARNDLEAPAMALVPAIADVLDALRTCPEASLARMSGSGATCFALFDTESACAQAAATLKADHPGWWVMPSRLR